MTSADFANKTSFSKTHSNDEDPFETMIKKTGCMDLHYKVQVESSHHLHHRLKRPYSRIFIMELFIRTGPYATCGSLVPHDTSVVPFVCYLIIYQTV